MLVCNKDYIYFGAGAVQEIQCCEQLVIKFVAALYTTVLSVYMVILNFNLNRIMLLFCEDLNVAPS